MAAGLPEPSKLLISYESRKQRFLVLQLDLFLIEQSVCLFLIHHVRTSHVRDFKSDWPGESVCKPPISISVPVLPTYILQPHAILIWFRLSLHKPEPCHDNVMANKSSYLFSWNTLSLFIAALLLSTMAVTKIRAYAIAALFLVIVVPFTLLHLANGLSGVLSSSENLWKDNDTDGLHPIGNETLGVSNFSNVWYHPERWPFLVRADPRPEFARAIRQTRRTVTCCISIWDQAQLSRWRQRRKCPR